MKARLASDPRNQFVKVPRLHGKERIGRSHAFDVFSKRYLKAFRDDRNSSLLRTLPLGHLNPHDQALFSNVSGGEH